jgi:hypothetical protein
MKLLTLCCLFFISLCLFACTPAQPPSSEKLVQLFNASPIDDAHQAYRKSDFRFISVHNHHPIAPRNIPECLTALHGTRQISNESFQYGSYDYQRYGALAEIYANWYNYKMWELLEKSDQIEC